MVATHVGESGEYGDFGEFLSNKTPQVVSVGCNGVWVMGNVVVCECGK